MITGQICASSRSGFRRGILRIVSGGLRIQKPLGSTLTGVFAVTLACGPEIDFAQDLQPGLADDCYACHGPDEEERKGDPRLDMEGGALAALLKGDPDSSELIGRFRLASIHLRWRIECRMSRRT